MPHGTIQIPHARFQREAVPVQEQHRRFNLVPRRITVRVLVKECECSFGSFKVGKEAGDIFQFNVGFSGRAERVEQAAREGFGLVGRGKSGGDLISGRVGLPVG